MIEQRGVLTHKSAENANAAYVGLSDGDAGDDYSIKFETEDRITVCRGTTSDWHIIKPADDMPVMVDRVEITGTVSGVTLDQPLHAPKQFGIQLRIE